MLGLLENKRSARMIAVLDFAAEVAGVPSDVLLQVFGRKAAEARAAAIAKDEKGGDVKWEDGEWWYVVPIKGADAGVSHLRAKSDGRRKYKPRRRPAAKPLQAKTLLQASARSFRNAAVGECKKRRMLAPCVS